MFLDVVLNGTVQYDLVRVSLVHPAWHHSHTRFDGAAETHEQTSCSQEAKKRNTGDLLGRN